jgi:MFS family permease
MAVLLVLQLLGGMMLSPQRTFFPVYLHELGYSALFISTLATLRQVMGLLASPLGGSLSDSWGRRRTLLLGELGFVSSSLVFLVTSPSATAVLWALGGLGMGLHTLGGQSYLMAAAPAGHLGLFTAFYNWGYTLGGTLSSPVAGLLLDRRGYTAFGLALTVLALGTIALNLLALPRSRAQRDAKASSWRALFGYRDLAGRPLVVMLVGLRFLPTVYWGMAMVLVPLLLVAAGASKTAIALYATASQAIAVLAQVAVGRAADRVGSKLPTAIAFSLLAVSALGIGLKGSQLWAMYVFGTLGTATAWSLSTLLPTWVVLVSEERERGRVLGWVHLWWNVGMIVGAMIGGALYERQPGLPFLVAGLLSVFSIALSFAFFRSASRTPSFQAADG